MKNGEAGTKYTPSENVKWCSCFENNLPIPQKVKQNYHLIQELLTQVYTNEK